MSLHVLEKGEKNFNTRKNAIIIGSAGSGKCHHPWDDLKPCPCGCKERPLLMYERINYIVVDQRKMYLLFAVYVEDILRNQIW